MNARGVIRRLESYRAGRPLPRGSTIHLEIASDPDLLALAFVRMGGESLPWAVGVAHPGGKARIWSVPDARDRDRVVEMLLELTPVLAGHLQSPMWADDVVEPDTELEDIPLRQIWVPNGSHVQMLHMLNLRYTFARAGEPERAAILRALGRLSGYLFREAGRLGEATIIDSTAALQEAFTFPADDLRQQHLGFLLALLNTRGGRAKRTAAAEEAERLSISTSLDPELEESLEPAVERFTKARRAGKRPAMGKAKREIARVLEAEIERRLEQVMATVALLRADKRPLNEGAKDLATSSKKHRRTDYLYFEERIAEDEESIFPPSPETDRGRSTGAARYHRIGAAEEEMEAALIHHDSEVQEDAIAAGDAVRGTIVKVEDRSPEESGAVIPVWTVESPREAPTRLRKGSKVCVAGIPRRTGIVLSVGVAGDTRTFEIEIIGWKKRPSKDRHPQFAELPAAADAALEGTDLILLPSSMGDLGSTKSRRVRSTIGPGAWLTHGDGIPPKPGRKPGGSLLTEVEKLRAA